LFLSRGTTKGPCWRLALLGSGRGSFDPERLPEDWRQAPIEQTRQMLPLPGLGSMTPARELARLLAGSATKIVLAGTERRSGWWMCGFELTDD
jgi:hypothetical protein